MKNVLKVVGTIWVLALLVVVLTHAAHCQDSYSQQFPDAPEPVKASPFGGYQHDPAGDPPRKPVFTKKFILVHVTSLGANIFDIEETQRCERNHTCLEGGGDAPAGGQYESRGEMYRNDMIVQGALFGFDYLMQRLHVPVVPYINPIYGTIIHLKGGISAARY